MLDARKISMCEQTDRLLQLVFGRCKVSRMCGCVGDGIICGFNMWAGNIKRWSRNRCRQCELCDRPKAIRSKTNQWAYLMMRRSGRHGEIIAASGD